MFSYDFLQFPRSGVKAGLGWAVLLHVTIAGDTLSAELGNLGLYSQRDPQLNCGSNPSEFSSAV